MKNITKKIFKLLPESLRLHLIRSNVQIPSGMDKLQVKIANTQGELEQAYELLHNSYVEQNLMDPNHSKLRFNIWSALPYTHVIVAKIGDEVIGTVSLIKDSAIGLPSDKAYNNENNELRRSGKRIVEVSALAVAPNYRKVGHKISLYLMKYLYQYTSSYLHADIICATVRHTVVDFYKALFSFEQKGKVIKYDFVKGTRANFIYLDLRERQMLKLKNIYLKYPDSSNIYNFCTSSENKEKFEFPSKIEGLITHQQMNPKVLEYFLIHKTALHKELNERELKLIQSAYDNHPSLVKNTNPLNKEKTPDRSNFRHLTQIQAVYITKDMAVMGTILDLSTDGAYFAPMQNLPIQENGSLMFTFQGQKFRIPCTTVWKNEGKSVRYPIGVGLKMTKQFLALRSIAQEINMEQISKEAA